MSTPRSYRSGTARRVGVLLVVALVLLSLPAVVAAQTETVEQEPNDSLADAATVGPGGTVTGAVTDVDDLDVYRLDLDAGQQFYVALSHDGTTGDLDLFFLDGSGTTLAVSDTEGGTYEAIFGVAPDTDNYYLVVVPFATSAETQYRLEVEAVDQPPSTGRTDADHEPNDDVEFASTLRVGTATGTIAHPLDVDVYAISLRAGQTVDVGLVTDDTDADLDLYVDGPQGEFLAESAGPGGTEMTRLVAPATDTYYVSVWPSSIAGATTYTLTVDRPATMGMAPGGMFSTARVLSPGLYASNASGPADLDIYAVQLRAGQQAQVAIAAETGNVDVYLYAPDQTLLDWSVQPTGTDAVATVAERSGTYYVLVVPYGTDEPTPYVFDVTVGDRTGG